MLCRPQEVPPPTAPLAVQRIGRRAGCTAARHCRRRMWVDANAYVADRSSPLFDASSAAHPAVALGETVVLGVPVPATRQGQRRGSPFGQRRPSNGQRSSVDQRGAVGRRSSRVQDAKDFLMHRTHAVAPSPVTVTEVTTVEALGAPPRAVSPSRSFDLRFVQAQVDEIELLEEQVRPTMAT